MTTSQPPRGTRARLESESAVARAVGWATGPRPGVKLIRAVFKIIELKAPRHAPVDGVESRLDLVYGKDAAERLDLHRPVRGLEPLPVIVWAHGGAWVGGDKSDVAFYLQLLAAEGHACAAINYSLAPDAHYPEPLRQMGRALQWLVQHAVELNLDPQRIVLAGSSAGAQIAGQYAALVADPGYATALGIEPTISHDQLTGAILHCGPHDPETALQAKGWRGWYVRTVGEAYLGTKDFTAPQVRQASVVTHVTSTYPPTLLTAGDRDALSAQGHALEARLSALGVDHQTLWYPGVDHEFQFDLHRPEAQDVLRATRAFLRSQVSPANRREDTA